jgi:hypothetical protein
VFYLANSPLTPEQKGRLLLWEKIPLLRPNSLLGGNMWKCKTCGERLEDEFEVCWNCQTERGQQPGKPSSASPTAYSPKAENAVESDGWECLACGADVTFEDRTCRTCGADVTEIGDHEGEPEEDVPVISTSTMILMPNESVLLETEQKILILTTHRIRYQSEAFGSAEIRSIMLDELASCVMVQTSHIILLILAGICLLGGIVVTTSGPRNEGALMIGVLLAVVLVIAYFASRRQILMLASSGTTITVNTQGMKLDWAKQFIEQTEAAKNARYLLGRG